MAPSNDVSHMEMLLGIAGWNLQAFFLSKSASDSTLFGDVSDWNKKMYWQSAQNFPTTETLEVKIGGETIVG